MSMGEVTVNNLNLNQGKPTEIERLFLFCGKSKSKPDDMNKVHPIDKDTDLDKLLGIEDSNLKTQLTAAENNGGQNWFGYALPVKDDDNPLDEVFKALAETSVEAVVLTDPVATKKNVEDAETMAKRIISTYQRRVFFILSFRQLNADASAGETWSEYVTAAKAITENVAAERVMITPLVYYDFQGTLAGRLCNKVASIADSPMRTATGYLIGNYAIKPVDKNGDLLTKAVLKALHDDGRYTVPTWYEDYDGFYTSDGFTLAPSTSDYWVIEYLRVADKAARRIYQLAVARVADRRLNSTPQSIESNRTYFMRPLREMSHSIKFAGETFPGEIRQPKDTDISIVWPTKYKVQVFFKLTPYHSPKAIECNIMLDLNNIQGA